MEEFLIGQHPVAVYLILCAWIMGLIWIIRYFALK
jgi:hypothetical protein